MLKFNAKEKFEKFLNNYRNFNLFNSFLTTEEKRNIFKLNKKINFTYNKWFTKCKNNDYLFNKNFYFEIKNLKKIKEIILISDQIYMKTYKFLYRLVAFFYFSFVVLVIDVFTLLLILIKDSKQLNSYCQIPFIILWLICIISGIIYLVVNNRLIKKINKLIDSIITDATQSQNERLAQKLKYRINNQQPIAFKLISISYILFYIPIIIKFGIKNFKKWSYQYAFSFVMSIIFIIYFFKQFYFFIQEKYNNRITKNFLYKKIYNNGDSLYYQNKIKNYISKSKKSYCGEITMTISLYTTKIIIFLIISLYFSALGKKLDDLKSKTPYRFIFIPFYLTTIIIIIWGILYIYSIKKFELKYKPILYINICILVLCSIFDSVFVPLMLDKVIKISALFPACNNILISISIFLHYFLVKNQKFNKIIEEENKKEIYNNIIIETKE